MVRDTTTTVIPQLSFGMKSAKIAVFNLRDFTKALGWASNIGQNHSRKRKETNNKVGDDQSLVLEARVVPECSQVRR